MLSLTVAGGAAVAMLASGLLGLLLQRKLPEAHTSDRSRDIIGGVVGLVTLLLALVLGLLIWTAYGVTNTQKGELQLLSARALEFDLEMKQFGPEAERARDLLRTEIVWAHEQFWGDDDAKSEAYDASYKNMGAMSDFLNNLRPANDTQKQLLGAASQHYGAIGETPVADVVAIARSNILAVDNHRNCMVVSVVLWVWFVITHERNDAMHAGIGCMFRRERHFSDPGTQPALYEPVKDFADRAGAGYCES